MFTTNIDRDSDTPILPEGQEVRCANCSYEGPGDIKNICSNCGQNTLYVKIELDE